MTTKYSESLDLSPYLQDGQFEIHRNHSRYTILWTEGCESNPAIAFRAQQIHGQSYVDAGYFSADALDEYGRLVEELDGTRERAGKDLSITYLLATPKGAGVEDSIATMRLISIPEGGGIEDIPTYKYFKEGMSLEVQQKLHGIISEHGRQSVIEIAALASVGRSGAHGSYELMRSVIQNSIIRKSEGRSSEIYVTALTDKSLNPILEFAGLGASEIIGEPVHIFADEKRSGENLRVTPVLVDPHKILDSLITDITHVSNRDRGGLEAKLQFLTDGLTEFQMGKEVFRIVSEISFDSKH